MSALGPVSSETEAARRALELRRFLEEFVAGSDDPLAWVNVPAHASLQTLGGARDLAPARAPLTGRERLGESIRSVRQARGDPAQAARYYRAGDVLFEADGLNHLRALEPVMHELGEPVPVAPVRAGSRRVAKLVSRALAVADRLVREARAAGVWLAIEPQRLAWSFTAGARYLAHSEALLAQFGPEAVVCASATNIPPRALIHVARASGTPSVFLPHAPIVGDPFYNDLPVDYAGLRGEQEAASFVAWGVERRRLDVVGDPSLEDSPLPALSAERAPVFAPPVNPPDLLPGLFEDVRSVFGDDEVTVSPHPRADIGRTRSLMPDGWDLWEGRTLELLEQGPPMLLQHSSGVALEALRLGIPTIELRLPAWPPTYPAIQEPYVHLAASVDELRAAAATARRDGSDDSKRAALTNWAEGWSRSGGDAAAHAAALVRTAAAHGAPGAIWDAWRAEASVRERLPRLTGA